MAQNVEGETREMRLISRLIKMSPAVAETSLPQFIAVRRQPGDGWLTWDQITIDLHQIIGEVITDVSLRRWAYRYGIPDQGDTTKAEYAKALRKAGIEI